MEQQFNNILNQIIQQDSLEVVNNKGCSLVGWSWYAKTNTAHY